MRRRPSTSSTGPPPSTSHSALGHLIGQFGRQRVLVVGDMVADEYLLGRPTRISREAPVLVLQFSTSFVRPGGATNTAYNLSTLGARTSVVGVIGDDEMGRRLKEVLQRAGMGVDGLLVDLHRPTSTKTRVLAKGTQEVQQQVVRIDRVDSSPLSDQVRDRMVDVLCRQLQDVDALLISDYENGVISPEVIEACLVQAQANQLVVTVDSHGDLLRFKGVTATTPNQPEAESTLNMTIETDEDLEEAGRRLLEGMEAQGILITRGSEGLVLFERGRQSYRLPVSSDHGAIVDPSGAGDTVAAVFTLAIASGAAMRTAAYLSNIAGGEVVRKLGAASLEPSELREAVRRCTLPPPR